MRQEYLKPVRDFGLASLLATVVFIAGGLMFSFGPAEDGDLWWQMAYGRYFLEHGTLIPDHSIYSWTVATNSHIYCAWIGELALYLVYKYTGMIGLGVMRALIMLLPLFILLWMQRKEKSSLPVLVLLGALLCYLVSRNAGGLLKPELFSCGLFTVLVALYFLIKRSRDDALKYIYAIPLLMLIWVNTHGAFVIGCFFLAVAVVGEGINFVAKPSPGLSPNQFKHIAIASVLSIFALFLTPYGYEYPLQLVTQSINGAQNENFTNVSAYLSIFDDSLSHLDMPLYLGMSLLILLPFFVEKLVKRSVDFGLILVIIAFLVLSTGYGRLSYFLPVVLLFSLRHMVLDSQWWSKIRHNPNLHRAIALSSLILMIGMLAHRDQVIKLGDPRGGALQAGYLNPASETEFIQTYFPGERYCNGYNGGGYMLWKIGPTQKVMIDPRYFPYSSWYNDWFNMSTSATPASKISRFHCNLWVLNHKYEHMNSALVKMPEWKLVFVGEAAAVYARPEQFAKMGGLQLSGGLPEVTSLPRTALILNLLLYSGELKHALWLAESIQPRWSDTGNAEKAKNALDFVRGTIAFKAENYFVAYGLLSSANTEDAVISNRKRQIQAGQFLTEKRWHENDISSAQHVAVEVLTLNPDNIISLYNAASLSLENANQYLIPENDDWKKWLTHFLNLSADESSIPPQYLVYARQMLDTGIAVSKPPLRLAPPNTLTDENQALLDSFIF